MNSRIKKGAGGAAACLALTAALVGLGGGNAQASGCTEGSRTQAAQYAAQGTYRVPVAPVWFSNTTGSSPAVSWSSKIELRYNPATRCAYGLISNARSQNNVWVDRSSDGGRTWQGLLGKRYVSAGNSSTYTGVYTDAGFVMRVCSDQVGTGRAVCTRWY